MDIDAFCRAPNHALLISGMPGAGKKTLAREIAAKLLGIDGTKLDAYPYFTELGGDDLTTISIEDVRSLQEALRLTTPGSASIRRILLVADASRMTKEAQNALLKSLEEPPEDTVIILTTPAYDDLLPTITSRTTRLWVKNPQKAACSEYFEKQGYSRDEIARAYNLSEGGVGLMHALLEEASDHPLAQSVQQAKAVIGMTRSERLAYIDTAAKDKDALLRLLFAIERVSHAMLLGAAERNDNNQIRRIARIMQHVLNSESALRLNANQKLVLTDLFLNI